MLDLETEKVRMIRQDYLHYARKKELEVLQLQKQLFDLQMFTLGHNEAMKN